MRCATPVLRSMTLMPCSARASGRYRSLSISASCRSTRTRRPSAAHRFSRTSNTPWPPSTPGLIDVALITHGEAGRSTRGRVGRDPTAAGSQYEAPYGMIGAPVAYAMACSRYMHMYGPERVRQGMADVSIATRKWALQNPKSFVNHPSWIGPADVGYEDYHDSRWIAWPFHIMDCCLVTDGGGACVVVSADVARNAKKKPAWILGSAEGHDHQIISQMPDLTRTIAHETGPRATADGGRHA